MSNKRFFLCSFLAIGLLAAAGCGDDAGSGSVQVTTYGEDFIEQQIPAATSGGEGIVDGYTVTYSKFLVAMSGLTVADASGTVAAKQSGALVFDLTKAGPHKVTTFAGLEAKRWDKVGMTVAPAKGATAGNASAADVKLLNDNGYAVYLEGKATKSGKTFSFLWGFTTATRYDSCHEKSTGAGVVVPSGGTVTIQFTVHGDHLFYDDLQSSDPSLRFDAVAKADAESDGKVTMDELKKVDLTTLPSGQYGTGGAGSVKNLAQFITAQSRTLIHYQGEGHCHSSTP